MSSTRLLRTLWVWPLVISLALWIAAGIVQGHISGGLLLTNAEIATFLALVALGQMVVVTSGDGSYDISLPYILTLSAYVSAVVMGGRNSHLVVGIAAALGASMLVGVVNGVLIALVRIPPIITTLAVGYMVETWLELYASGTSGLPSPALDNFVHRRFATVPFTILFTVIVAIAVLFAVKRTRYGFWLAGMGQSRGAAYLVGIPLGRMILVNFVFSALMGGLAGLLLGAFSGGPFITMGAPYLLPSIGAVVIGGTAISGGVSSVPGTLVGAFFLTWIVTFVQIVHVSPGLEDVIVGLVVILIAAIPSVGLVRLGARESLR